MASIELIRSIWEKAAQIDDAPSRSHALAALVALLPQSEKESAWWKLVEACSDYDDASCAAILATLMQNPYDDSALSETLIWAADHLSQPEDLMRVADQAARYSNDDSVQESVFEQAARAGTETITLGFLLTLEVRTMRRRDASRWYQLARSLTDTRLLAIAALQLAENDWRSGQKWALSMAAGCDSDDLRNRIHLAVETSRWESNGSDLTARRAVENLRLLDAEKRIQAQLSCLYFGADDQTLRLVTDDVVSQLAQVDDPAVRLHYLDALGTIVPGGLPGPWPDALRLVTAIESERLRAKGLTSLFWIDNTLLGPGHAVEILGEAEKLNDPWARAEVLFAFGTSPPPGVSGDRWRAQLVSALQAVDNPAAVARIGIRALIGDPSVDTTDIGQLAVSAVLAMPDSWAKVRSVEALLHVGAGGADLLAAGWTATAAIAGIGKRAMAQAKLSRYLSKDSYEAQVLQLFADLFGSANPREIAEWTRAAVDAAALSWWEGPDE